MATGIHSAARPRYPHGMAAADQVSPERRRLSLRMPRPWWRGVAAAVLIVAA